MKQPYLTLFFVLLSSSVLAQIKRYDIKEKVNIESHSLSKTLNKKVPKSYGTVSKETYFKGEKSLSQCGSDTLEYLASKASIFEWYLINDTANSLYNSGYSQYYETPQAITVEGACFYAYNYDSGVTTDMTVSLYSVTTDSFPDQLLAQAQVQVTDAYSATNLNMMKYCVTFPSPVTVSNQGFHIAVSNPTVDNVLLLSNSYNNSDGAGEALSYAFYSDSAYPAFVGWYNQYDPTFYDWDFDWIINPIVSYDLETTASLTNTNECEGDSVCFDVSISPVFYSTMYHNGSQTQYWSWGDGSIGTNDSCHVYNISGSYEAIAYVNMQGWNTNCYSADTVNLTVQPLPMASFNVINQGSLQVTVEDNGSIGDSVVFFMGDFTSYSGVGPHTHSYASSDTVEIMLIAYNTCGTDTAYATFVPDTALGLFDLNSRVEVYPNPANNFVNIQLQTGQRAQLKLFNMQGKLIWNEAFVGETKLNISTFSEGMYTLQIHTINGIANKPLLINH